MEKQQSNDVVKEGQSGCMMEKIVNLNKSKTTKS